MVFRWVFEGQPEIAAAVADQALALYPQLLAWKAGWAFSLALLGQTSKLRDFLADLPSILPHVPVDFVGLAAHFFFGLAQGFGVVNPKAAATVYEALLPYRSLHAGSGVDYWGPIELALGVLARVLGDTDSALAHHELGAETIDACGAARPRALNSYQWVPALLARNAPGDRQQVPAGSAEPREIAALRPHGRRHAPPWRFRWGSHEQR